jgi:hypothetical protein
VRKVQRRKKFRLIGGKTSWRHINMQSLYGENATLGGLQQNGGADRAVWPLYFYISPNGTLGTFCIPQSFENE